MFRFSMFHFLSERFKASRESLKRYEGPAFLQSLAVPMLDKIVKYKIPPIFAKMLPERLGEPSEKKCDVYILQV